MKRIELANNTVIEIPTGPVGISCSGGTDSSLLLYILMKHTKDPIHIFTLSNNKKGRANAVVVPRVIERCIQLTDNINVIHLKSKTISCVFFGVTANPPSDVVFASPSTEERDPTVIKNEVDYNGFLRRPFVNKDKKTIADIYKQLNLMETLFPVTRSCEQIGKLEYYDHCGQCWWCEERQWGFGRV
jgi:7-cyano-7-deazaguanine synthase in queuosine biosynthesis